MRYSWEGLQCFRAAVAERSLTAGAAKMGLSTATLTRRVERLEHELGLQLLKRDARGAKPTKDGAQILNAVSLGGDHLDEVARLAQSLRLDEAQDAIRISSTEPVIADVLAPALGALVRRDSNARVTLESSLLQVSLNKGDADIAVRMVRPNADSLITKKLPAIKMQLFVSPDLTSGKRTNLMDLDVPLLWYDDAFGDIAENTWLADSGLKERVSFRASSVRALLHATKAGVGAAPLPTFLAKQAGLAAIPGPVLPNRVPWLVFHRDSRNIARHKTVRKWIVDSCRKAFTV
ncbi:MAG: LysR family transcriptional regulator [Pseudomonadota bacterium]